MGTFTLTADFREFDDGADTTNKVTISANTQVIGADDEIYSHTVAPVVGGLLSVTLPATDASPGSFGYTVRREYGQTKKWQVPAQAPGATVSLAQFTSTTPLPLPPTTVVNSVVGQTGVVTAEEVAAAIAGTDALSDAIDAALAGSADGAPQVNPVLSITTAGGAEIVSKETYVNAIMALTGVPGQADIFDTLRIRGRGNLTWLLPKKPYKLKLDNSQPMLGHPTSKDWALLASYTDKGAINTAIADQIGYLATGLDWTPKYGFVDLFLNNTYMGNYQLIESVVLAASRVNATKATGTTGLPLTGAYLAEINNGGQDPDDPDFTTTHGVRVLFDDPDGTDATQAAYFADWVQDFEDVLFGVGFDDPDTGFRAWVDTDSFIDWFLIEQLALNLQGYLGSAKIYKTRDVDGTPGKLFMGPLWDFDESFGTSNAGNVPATNEITGLIWHDRMLEDPVFASEVATRWTTLKAAITGAGGINKIIDRAISRTASAQIRDGGKWEYEPDWSALSTYKKTWVAARIAYMDATFGEVPGYDDAVLADNPVSYWRLGETSGTVAADVKNANVGTYVNAPTLGVAGAVSDGNKAVTLDGTNDRVLLKTGAILSGLTNWTIEAWWKVAGFDTGCLYSERGSSGNDIINVLIEGDGRYKLQYRDHAGTLDQVTSTTGNAQSGTWHHVVITKAGTTVKFYEDKVLIGTSTLTATDTFGEASIVTGLGVDLQDGNYLAGSIDEVAVYNVALSGAQVAAHFDAA